MDINNEIQNLVQYAWTQRDKRADNYFLLDSPLPTLYLSLLYLLFSISAKWIMNNKEPFHLKKLIVIYNVAVIVANGYLFYQCIYYWFGTYRFICEPVGKSTPDDLFMVKLVYFFYLTKFLDWFDTIFFVLRKKFTQISILHIYHHGIMPISCWFIVRFTPGGHITMNGFLNSLVHFVMYSYYALSALGPQWHKYLWWKKYLTIIQMLQFIFVFIYDLTVFYGDCDYPKPIIYYCSIQAIIFLSLFYNFYLKSYKIVKSTKKK